MSQNKLHHHHIPAFWSHSFWNGKRKQAHIWKSYHLLIFTIKIPPKGWNDDENETLHWIMRWGWMRWKWNLAFNNDDGKKLYTRKLFTLKKIKKFKYYYSPPALSFSSSLSENRNKIAKKMYYPWIHYAVQNVLPMNTLRSSELTQFKQDSIAVAY